ncbi:MAG: DUF2505 domain-containing protein [Actinomycetales bacterium]
MATSITETISYPAPPARVAELLRDPEFVQARCEATGSRESQVEVTDAGAGSFTVATVRAFPTDRFPSIVRSAVGDLLHVRQEDTWHPQPDGSWQGTSEVTTVGAPGRLTADAWLLPAGEQTRQEVTGSISAVIPLGGGKIEALSADAAREALLVEQRLAAEWLRR